MVLAEFPNYGVNKDGVVFNVKTGHILTPVVKNGYFGVRLSRDAKVTFKSVHLLVYDAFIGGRKPGMHIDHINGIRTDNRIINLRQVTPEQNNANRLHLVRGENVNTAKLTEADVMDIRKEKAAGANSRTLAERYGISKGAINRVATGKTWKHLPALPVDNMLWSDATTTGAMSGKKLREKYGQDYFARIAKGRRMIKHCTTCTCAQT